MGGFLSVSVSCDQVVNQASQWLCLKGSYIHDLTENLASLEKAMGLLKAKRDDVQERVNREEFTGQHRRLAQVQVWLTNILIIENQYNDLISTRELEFQRLCLCGFCSKDFKSSYRYGKMVILMLKEVESLSSRGEFDVVTEAVPIAKVEELPTQRTIVGQENLLKTVWSRLMDDKVGIVGLYGMGGVGKTTLLTQINNKFSEIGGGFDVVIWVVVSKNATVHKVQGGIGKKLGLEGKEWDEKDENQRAIDIHNVLRRKKFVLFLDDVWEKVVLNVVGVPYPSRENGSKVAITTRFRDVCGCMEVDDPIEVRCLDPENAWDLFKKKVGERTLANHPDIPELARKVARKCRGLPLALSVIGEAMACKSTIQEWHQAVYILTSYAIEFPGMVEDILPILKYSYDSLKGEQEGKNCVNMHDVVRDMALWIACDLGKYKERCVVHAGIGLREILKVDNWKSVRRMSLMENDIRTMSESHECPELTTLLLGGNRSLATISGEFFRCMPRLLVLDLLKNRGLRELPEQISRLVSLRYLDLAHTKIGHLPDGLHELKMLIHLDLRYTKELESLQGISNLTNLRTLKLIGSRVWPDMGLMKELQLLQHLEFINITISSSLVEEQYLYDARVGRCIQVLTISERSEESVRVLNLPAKDKLHEVLIADCGMLEIEIKKTLRNKSLTSPCFTNLSHVLISCCNGLKDLTWLLFAPNLISLMVWESMKLEEIISKEKAASVLEKGTCTICPFQKLERLELKDLPELKSIYWSALPFQRLISVYLKKCPELRKLPFDSRSVFKVEELVIDYTGEEWLERVEWADEATHHRFLPQLNKLVSFFDNSDFDSSELSLSSLDSE